jgi:hypothetical protein
VALDVQHVEARHAADRGLDRGVLGVRERVAPGDEGVGVVVGGGGAARGVDRGERIPVGAVDRGRGSVVHGRQA